MGWVPRPVARPRRVLLRIPRAAGGPPAPYRGTTPTYWFDARYMGAEVPGPISAWPALAGSDATATAGAEPTLTANVIGTNPGVVFATNKYMTFSRSNPTGSTSLFLLIVPSAFNTFDANWNHYLTAPEAAVILTSAGNWRASMLANEGDPVISGTLAYGVPHLLQVHRRGDRSNCTIVDGTNGDVAATTGTQLYRADNTAYIGSFDPSYRFISGAVCAIYGIDGALDDATADAVAGDILADWGL